MPLRARIGWAVATLFIAVFFVRLTAQGSAVNIALDADDVGGVVKGSNGPEAGVWVIAETTDLQTKFARIVVTDDQGRYVIPDLPKASYKVWVRGYGLVDSPPVQGMPGRRLDLTAVLAPTPRAAAEYYPAAYWLALLQIPPASDFPGTGPNGNGIPTQYRTQEQWVSQMKFCFTCHQLGNKATREIPKELGSFPSTIAAWDHRIQIGQSGVPSSNNADAVGRDRLLKMFADWTDRIAAGELPKETPKRPAGIERNVVISMWDWGGPEGYGFVNDVIATDPRTPTKNGNGPVYGINNSKAALDWLDPKTNTVHEVKVPGMEPNAKWDSNLGPMRVLRPSPAWGNRLTWDPVAPHNITMDDKGRVWISARFRDAAKQPAYCKDPQNLFNSYFPLMGGGGYEVEVFDPATQQFSFVDTCGTVLYPRNAFDRDNSIFWSSANYFGWLNTRQWDASHKPETSYGWCPAVLDTNGDGRIARGWTEPDQAVDPTKDHRIQFACYENGTSPDGSEWCAPWQYPGYVTRLERGSNPPQSCKAEKFDLPMSSPAWLPRGLDVDRNGVVWMSFAGSGHLASFDRRKCKVLNGPTATGQHCPEGWTMYEGPGPKLQGSTGKADWYFIATVDRENVLGFGRDIPMTQAPMSDAVLVLKPMTREWITLRVPYPLGFFVRATDPRIDDANAGWKGRGLWSDYATVPNWHIEGGKGTLSKVVKFQIRPNPMAK